MVTPVESALNEVDIEPRDEFIVVFKLSFSRTISAFKFAISSDSLLSLFGLDLIFKYKIAIVTNSNKINIVNKYLDRNWSIDGKVNVGRKMGRKIGFPTCNIKLNDYVIAKPGVYAVNILINKNKKLLRGIANLGYRPTFNQKEILLEVHIFNFSKNLYNKSLTIDFIDFIRKEKRFKNINQLKKQINLDIRKAKKKLK